MDIALCIVVFALGAWFCLLFLRGTSSHQQVKFSPVHLGSVHLPYEYEQQAPCQPRYLGQLLAQVNTMDIS